MSHPSPWPDLDLLERRFDGPALPADPAFTERPQAMARARLFQRLAAERRRVIALSRLGWGDESGLERNVRRLRFYRDQGVAWMQLGRRNADSAARSNP